MRRDQPQQPQGNPKDYVSRQDAKSAKIPGVAVLRRLSSVLPFRLPTTDYRLPRLLALQPLAGPLQSSPTWMARHCPMRNQTGSGRWIGDHTWREDGPETFSFPPFLQQLLR
jgi:hypothetical protein